MGLLVRIVDVKMQGLVILSFLKIQTTIGQSNGVWLISQTQI